MKDELNAETVDDVLVDDLGVEEAIADDTEEDEIEIDETDDDDVEAQDESEAEQEAEDADVLTVTLGEEEDEEEVSQPFREMRQRLRDTERELKALKSAKVEATPELGEKPKLENFDYDAEKFEAALIDWNDRKVKIETKQREERELAEAAVAEFEEKKASYKSASKALGVKDFGEAEEVVNATLPPIVREIIIDNAVNPALLTYALGKNPKAMEKISKATTMREAIAAGYQIAQIEAKMTVAGAKTSKPKPEGRIEGGVKPAKMGNRQLEKLRAEAEKTGDYSKVVAFRKKMRAK